MNELKRKFSLYAGECDKAGLESLLNSTNNPKKYKETMLSLGASLGEIVGLKIQDGSKCLIVSTAEDADFLSNGVREALLKKFETSTAVFWNNHYSISSGSVAPILHSYLQPGYKSSDTLVVAKSVISGSCVVRTNILALIESLQVKNIFIVSPVMHSSSELNLKKEFPKEISDKFDFVYFAIDSVKDISGEVKPGIGGQIYNLLGLSDQPVRAEYIPELVKSLAFS